MSDYHVHLVPHGVHVDTVEPLETIIERAVEHAASVGVTEIGFTEHWFRCVESEPILGPFWEAEPKADLAEQARSAVIEDRTLSLDRYIDAVQRSKDRGLPVKLGLEVDFFPETIEAVVEFLEPYPWDFLIGSVHWIVGWGVDDDRASHEFDRRGVDRAWKEYFELETELASSGAVDVLAHVDVVKRQGYRPERPPIEWYDRVVAAAAASGTAVEVSSQGLRSPAAEVYPAPAFLERFAAAGVPITLASDAHVPNQVGDQHDAVVAAARQAGYESHVRFTRRRPEPHPLPERSTTSR